MPPIRSGMIVLWSGAILEIPPGYWLCDGTHGTPDLRDRFIIGAGSTYAVDATGGNVSHTHDFTTDGHDHVLPAYISIDAGEDFDDITSIDADTGTTDPGSSLPPYFALAYIMKA